MSTALVSFYDFGDHCSYRSNSASTTLQNSKNGFVDRNTSVYNSVQQNNNNNNNLTNNNNNINNNINSNLNNNVNVITRRVVTTTASVPINLSHSSHRLQSSTPTVPVMHPKSPIGVSNTQPSVGLVRGLSTGSHQCSQSNNNNMNTINGNNNNKEHKKLDRSYSEPAEKTQQLVRLNSTTTVAGPMSSRYKTELCRSFAEVGTCKYGDKCQFAHGGHELRVITRHPKFKTENCKSFHSTGFCPYGPRCHFIHNSEESKKCMLNNLSGTGSGNGVTTNGSQTRIGDQIITNSNINANNSMTNNGFGQTYHSNNNSHPLRPKALSIGSYSLGSSGEISPPSSQSGSPTSLNSFFTEDPFNPFASPSNHALGSCANNAFSFSPDFASLVSTTHINNKNTFGGSQPTLCPAFPLATNINGSDISDQSVVVPTIFSNQFSTSSTNPALDHHMNEGTQGMATTPPPQQTTAKVTPVSYPVAPESPVDSIASDVDALKLEQSSLSPIPTCSSPLELTKSLPRLPIFTRFANNGNNNNNELE